jgi:hypothetical protein
VGLHAVSLRLLPQLTTGRLTYPSGFQPRPEGAFRARGQTRHRRRYVTAYLGIAIRFLSIKNVYVRTIELSAPIALAWLPIEKSRLPKASNELSRVNRRVDADRTSYMAANAATGGGT